MREKAPVNRGLFTFWIPLKSPPVKVFSPIDFCFGLLLLCLVRTKSYCNKSKYPDVGYSGSGKAKTNTMKRKSFLLVGISFVMLLMSCDKKVADAKPSVTEFAKTIYTTESFIGFTRSFITDYKNLAAYYQAPAIKSNSSQFISRLKEAGDNEAQIGNVYTSYSLSLSEAIIRKNKVDNDLLQLFHQNKLLLKYNENEVWEIIREGINLGWQSQLPDWQDLRTEARAGSINTIRQQSSIGGPGYVVSNKITLDEVWDCMKGALGIGAASAMGIAGLQKLAQQGIQQVVITVSEFLAKRAGWIGAAIILIDFGSCIYKESAD